MILDCLIGLTAIAVFGCAVFLRDVSLALQAIAAKTVANNVTVNVPEPQQPHVIVKLVPGEVETHPAAMFPAKRTTVEILKGGPGDDEMQHIGYREIGHGDIQHALDSPGLAVRWPSGDVDYGTQ